jgi:serine/threonine-protein kinase
MNESALPDGVVDRLQKTVALLGARSPDQTLRAKPSLPPAPSLPLLSIERGDEEETTSTRREIVRRGDLLGVGGMGEVYAGVQRSLGRSVALKFVTGADTSMEREARAGLLREARITGQLEHPNIVPVHVLGVDEGGVPVMVMKRIEGVSWRALLRDPAHPQWRRWEQQHRDALESHLSVLLSVCDALEYAHQKRVIHRDIKPDNVMIGPFGEVYLLDWGIALELDAPAVPDDAPLCGTPAYMAPEQVDSAIAPAGPTTDVYLLGASLYEVLEGHPPHEAPGLFEALAHALLSEPPTFASDPPAPLAALCAAAMRGVPAERLESVAAFHAGLREWLAHRDSLASSELGEEALEALGGESLAHREQADNLARALDARLAYERALRLWPGNPHASAGLVRATRAMFALELARRHAAAARSLLDELVRHGAARPEDEAALAALEAAQDAERAEAARAKRAQEQLDLSGWRSARVWLFGVVTFASVIAGAMIARAPEPTFEMLLPPDLLIVGLIVVAIAALRHRLTSNRLGRQLAAVVLLCALGSTATDVFGLWLDWPVLWASVHRLLAIGVVLAFAAFMELRALAVGAALAGAGAVSVVLLPDRHAAIVPGVLLGINVVVGWLATTGRLRSSDAID